MATKIRFAILLIATATLSCSPTGEQRKAKTSPEEKALKNWALSYCIANTLEPGPAKQDALNTAGAYLEAGNQPIEAYEKATQLIKLYLAKNYTGVTPGAFNTKKCIDLYESAELEWLARDFNEK